MNWAEPARSAYCRLAVDLNIFELLRDGGRPESISADDIAEKTGADPTLALTYSETPRSNESRY